jgi:hypothetical protein
MEINEEKMRYAGCRCYFENGYFFACSRKNRTNSFGAFEKIQ